MVVSVNKLYRCFAIAGSVLLTLTIAMNIFVPIPVSEYDVIPLWLTITVNVVSLIIFIYLIICPQNYRIFSAALCCQGIFSIVDLEILIGTVLYALGVIILYYREFFKNKTAVKVGVLSTAYLIPAVVWFFLKKQNRVELIIKVLFLAASVLSINFGIKSYEKNRKRRKGEKSSRYYHAEVIRLPNEGGVLDLSPYNFSLQTLYGIESIRRNEPLKNIAIDMHMKESTVRMMMSRLYRRFGVDNKQGLHILLNKYTIRYPPYFDMETVLEYI